ARRGGAAVDGRSDVAARCRHVDQAAGVGEARARAGAGRRGHGDDVVAAGRREAGGVGVAVARGDHHRGTAADGAVDGVLVARRTGTTAAQAHVDDLGRVRVGRHATHAAARRPDDAVNDVGGVATTLAEHADRNHLGAVGDAGHAGVVVGHCRDGARHVGTVPAGVGSGITGRALVGGIPVALVLGVAVTPVSVTRHAGIGDEVVTRQHIAVQVAVVGDAGVDHRHHHAAAGGGVPGLVGLDAAGRLPVMPLVAGVVGVVGRGDRLHQLVDFDVLDVRVGGEAAHQRFGVATVQLALGPDHFGPDRGAAQFLQAQRLAVQGRGGGGIQRAVQGGGVAPLGAAFLVLHDETVVAVGRLQRRDIDHALAGGHGRRCQHG